MGAGEKPMLSELPDLVRAAVKREWLPIEDAPRDGNSVLIYSPDASGDGIMVGIYSGWVEDYWVDAVDGGLIDAEPTHYMPLPAPPQTEG